ncbi:MAG: hydroxymethylbilane synthase [Dehalococcoidia bacterium]
MPQRSFLIGTRQSRLAVRQTEIVLESLRSAHPDVSLEVRTVRTTGDDSPASLGEIGGRGVFVIELEQALLAGDIDIAVHSLKDLPSRETVGLTIAAVGRREEPRDAIVARDGLALADLPPSATVGSGSPRRVAQLLALRPDLRVADIRGNVDTRIRKVQDGEYDAVIVAAAGLVRLGWLERATELLPLDVMLPAVGQGALAVQVRADDVEAMDLVQAADDLPTRVATAAERAFERGLGACLPDGSAGCQAAIAALGEVAGDRLRLRGLVADPAGDRLLRDEVEGPSRDGELLGAGLAGRLLEQGAAALHLAAAS